MLRKGVRHILETQDSWEVAGEASNGEEAIRLNQQLKPDAIVMDIMMPVMNGLDATRAIVKSDPSSKVLIFTMYDGPGLMESVEHSGAQDVLGKSQATAELTPALKFCRDNALDSAMRSVTEEVCLDFCLGGTGPRRHVLRTGAGPAGKKDERTKCRQCEKGVPDRPAFVQQLNLESTEQAAFEAKAFHLKSLLEGLGLKSL